MNAREIDLVTRALGHLDSSRYARQAGDIGSAESALDASRRILLELASIPIEEQTANGDIELCNRSEMTAPKIPLKTTVTLTISDIRYLFETSADANVVRDCVRAIGAGIGGVFETAIKDYQSLSATDRLVNVFNAGRSPRVVMKHRDFTIASVEFHQPYYIQGMCIRSGYHICSEDGLINVMPGACWFMTIVDAQRGIDCLIEAGGAPRPPYQRDDGVGDRFWELLRARRWSRGITGGCQDP